MCATPPSGTGASVAVLSNSAGHSEQQTETGLHICDYTNLTHHKRAAPNHFMCIVMIMTKSHITVKAINHKYSH